MNFYKLKRDDKFQHVDYAEGTDWGSIKCPVYEGHQRAGKRIGDLRIDIVDKKASDFLWTFLSECLITDRTASLFKDAGFTGFKLKPVQVCNKNVYPVLWEFIVTGKGGDVTSINGIELKKKCDYCGSVEYSGFGQGLKIDEKQWDGSDFFTVWPLPKYIIITERVRDYMLANKISNVRAIPVQDLIGKGKEGGLGPGSFDDWINNI